MFHIMCENLSDEHIEELVIRFKLDPFVANPAGYRMPELFRYKPPGHRRYRKNMMFKLQ